MDMDGTAQLDAPPATVFAEVADLGTYPGWLGIVFGAEPSPPHPDDPGPAWVVELGAKIGPLPLTKKVRMVRTEHSPPERVRFERMDHGEEHSAWVLVAEVDPRKGGSELTIRLHYGGASKLPGVDGILRGEFEKAGPRLQSRLAART
ncbi:MAG TPA: SRPBCC family protein [Acidimicrobiales bacterium]|nr:SRPBCC family protein [Acidimicrobiales bacterium]